MVPPPIIIAFIMINANYLCIRHIGHKFSTSGYYSAPKLSIFATSCFVNFTNGHIGVTLFYEQKIKKLNGIEAPKCGSITSIQRCGSALNNNTHFHTLFIEGAFEKVSDEEVIFHRAPKPTNEEVASILKTITQKTIEFLQKKGFLKECEQETLNIWIIKSIITRKFVIFIRLILAKLLK